MKVGGSRHRNPEGFQGLLEKIPTTIGPQHVAQDTHGEEEPIGQLGAIALLTSVVGVNLR